MKKSKTIKNELHRVSGDAMFWNPGYSHGTGLGMTFPRDHFISVQTLTWNPRFPEISFYEVPSDLSRTGAGYLFDPRWPQ